MITTIKQAMKFIYGTSWKGSILGLERIRELTQRLGDPQKKLKFVHIAGTNGKGSTAAMTASILREAGYRTGLFTSPFIESFCELIQVDGVNISDEEIVQCTKKLQEKASEMKDSPTEYEIITALAFLHFLQKECDIVVLEVGMGGRLDSTNVIDPPEAAIITAIGLDHMKQLGAFTVEEIAAEKAGIIKGGTVICHPQIPSVREVIQKKCAETGATAHFAEKSVPADVKIPLAGEHQQRNAAVAYATAEHLRTHGWEISDAAIKNGIEKTFWPARFEILQESPAFIIDVAHNPQGIEATLATLSKNYPHAPPIFIFGVLADKDFSEMAQLLAPHAKRFFLVTPENPRALPAAELAAELSRHIPATNFEICESIADSITRAKAFAQDGDIICALGSLSLVGTIRRLFK